MKFLRKNFNYFLKNLKKIYKELFNIIYINLYTLIKYNF